MANEFLTIPLGGNDSAFRRLMDLQSRSIAEAFAVPFQDRMSQNGAKSPGKGVRKSGGGAVETGPDPDFSANPVLRGGFIPDRDAKGVNASPVGLVNAAGARS